MDLYIYIPIAIFLLLSAQDSRSSGTWAVLGQLFIFEAAGITHIGLRRW